MKIKLYLVAVLLGILFVGGWYYAELPVINIHESSFWFTVIWIAVVVGTIFLIAKAGSSVKNIKKKDFKNKKIFKKVKISKVSVVCYGLAIISCLVFIVGAVASSKLFRAKSYASLVNVKKCDFSKDLKESNGVDDIALMDTSSARIFGNRKIGSLSDVVSQFEVDEEYNQINLEGTPMKVAPLKYASFFKWWSNRNEGVPGYVKVNAVNSDAKYVKLKKGLKYTPSAYFNHNLQRHVRFAYPTKIIENYYFEVDDNGNPYYICPVLSAKIGMFGGRDVIGAVICDPITGDMNYYKVDKIPKWVDRVYDGELLTQKYNWYGTLSNGYFNSIISQKGCRITTDDYGYKTIDDDVWVYTGVTSVNGDKSNIGFVMMNQRTSETKYYSVSGADEHSAMSAAEGEVQEKGYKAAFPSLINVAGSPTYIMVLKDSGELVKRYAMVNVEQYNIVVTAATQEEAFNQYKKLLATEGKQKNLKVENKEKEITISDIQFVTSKGETTVYIKDENNQVYKQAFAEHEDLIKLYEGEKISIEYEEAEDGINYLISFKEVSLESATKSTTEETTQTVE